MIRALCLIDDWSSVSAPVTGGISLSALGAVGDGDDITDTLIEAAESGRKVVISPGIYRISRPISDANVDNIFVSGETGAYISHPAQGTIATYSSSYADMPPASLGLSHAVIICDGCNFVGRPDTISTAGYATNIRSVENVILWGNGGDAGMYIAGADTYISNTTLAMFRRAGIMSRGLITSRIDRVATLDCGWAVNGAGALGYPGSYVSGCGIMLLANMTPQNYTAITPEHRPTTIAMRDLYFWVRQHTSATKSGIRGLHAHGLTQFSADNIGGYTGNYWDVCTGGENRSCYVENYSASGLMAGDGSPICNVYANCNLIAATGYEYNAHPGKQKEIINSGVPGIPSIVTIRNSSGALVGYQ